MSESSSFDHLCTIVIGALEEGYLGSEGDGASGVGTDDTLQAYPPVV